MQVDREEDAVAALDPDALAELQEEVREPDLDPETGELDHAVLALDQLAGEEREDLLEQPRLMAEELEQFGAIDLEALRLLDRGDRGVRRARGEGRHRTEHLAGPEQSEDHGAADRGGARHLHAAAQDDEQGLAVLTLAQDRGVGVEGGEPAARRQSDPAGVRQIVEQGQPGEALGQDGGR
jgi:hypothetical protein